MNSSAKQETGLRLAPQELLPSLVVGLIAGAIGILLDISFAALIFSGALASHISVGIGMVLVSATLIRAFTALTSSFPGIIADLDSVPTAVLAWMAGAIAKFIEDHGLSGLMLIAMIVGLLMIVFTLT
ncbi:MAG TPA: hypothetical protein ACFE0H_09270 [Elainellaceae cyanobacterium]